MAVSEDDARGMVARLRDAVAAHEAHGGNGDATCDALDAMSRRCWAGPYVGCNRCVIGGTPGVVEGVLAAMAAHLGVAGVQKAGVQVLRSLAVYTDVNRERIGDTPGALDTIVVGMQAHAGNGGAQFYGMLVLHELAHNHVGNQHRMRATPQVLRMVASATGGRAEGYALRVLQALGLSRTQAHAAAAKVRCRHPHHCQCTSAYMYYSAASPP